jgi:hypothetical protein
MKLYRTSIRNPLFLRQTGLSIKTSHAVVVVVDVVVAVAVVVAVVGGDLSLWQHQICIHGHRQQYDQYLTQLKCNKISHIKDKNTQIFNTITLHKYNVKEQNNGGPLSHEYRERSSICFHDIAKQSVFYILVINNRHFRLLTFKLFYLFF